MLDRGFTWWLFCLAMFALSLSGAVSNVYYYNFGGEGVNVGTYLVFCITLLFFILGIFDIRRTFKYEGGRALFLMVSLGCALGIYYLIGYSSDKGVAVKATLSFFFLPFISLGAYALSHNRQSSLIVLLLALGGMFSVIGILQFIVGVNTTVAWQVLHGEEYLCFWDIGWIRPTAWVGNSIFYSALVFMLFVFAFQCYLSGGGKLAFMVTVLLASAIYVAMSRYTLMATIVCMAMISLMWSILSLDKKTFGKRVASVFISSAVLMMALSYYNGLGIGLWRLQADQGQVSTAQISSESDNPGQYLAPEPGIASANKPDTASGGPEDDSRAAENDANTPQTKSASFLPVIFDRFRASSQYSQGSNAMHATETKQAIQHVLEGQAPAGWGSEGISAHHSIITDGLWFQFAIEVGLVNAALFVAWLCIIFFVVMFRLGKSYKRDRQHAKISINQNTLVYVVGVTILAYLAYALLGGLINSSFAGRITYAIFWVMLGCFFCLMDHRDRDKQHA